MIKKIGYACINLNLKPRGFNDCRLNSVYKYGLNYLRDKIINNLILTKDILDWNIENGIFMYRITSKLLPLASHPDIIKDFEWHWHDDKEIHMYMKEIKDTVEKNHIRLSIHPDQFTVLNSLNEKVVKNSMDYLKYQYEVLKNLGGLDMIIHTGGVYGDKNASINRFIKNFYKLDETIQNMIRLENDDVSYNIDDVLYISSKTLIPIVLDIHHDRCNHEKDLNEDDIIKVNATWEKTGLIPKMHISSGKTHITDKRHSDYVRFEDFENIIKIIGTIDADLMVEAKKKDEAALKLIHRL